MAYDDLLQHPLTKRVKFHIDHPDHGRCYMFTDKTGNTRPISGITDFIKQYTHPFETEKIAKGVAFKRRRDDGWQGTWKDIADEWKTEGVLAAQYGTMIHDEIEEFAETGELTGSDVQQAFIELADGYDVVYPELTVVNPVLEVATQIDMVLHDGAGYLVWDWKTNKRIRFEGFKGQKMLPPFDDYDESEYYKYSMQISFAVHALQKHYKVQVSPNWDHKIVHFKNEMNPDEWPWGDEVYHPYIAFDMTDDFEQLEQAKYNQWNL